MAKNTASNFATSVAPTLPQKKVVKLLAEGLSVDEIAKQDGKTKREMYSEIERLKILSGAKNIPHLVAIFLRSKTIK